MVRASSIVCGTLACLALLGHGHAQPIMGSKNGSRPKNLNLITAPDAGKTSSSLSKRQERLEARAVAWNTVNQYTMGALATVLAAGGIVTVVVVKSGAAQDKE